MDVFEQTKRNSLQTMQTIASTKKPRTRTSTEGDKVTVFESAQLKFFGPESQ